MNKLLKFIFPAILLTISLFLCLKNYSPGTFLIGWDSLHPEFNFPEAFKRVIDGVWRAEEGVGAVAAHSHMSDWPRIVFLWLESFILPASFLRYSYIFLCIILGPLGVYFLLDYIFGRKRQGFESNVSAFFGALFYLLNLGTLQQFFVPFEMFPTQFAFLPWLFLFASKVLIDGKKKNYLLFAVLTIISSPQAYAATLFYAYFGALSVFCLIYFLLNRSRHVLRRSTCLIVLTILLNLYWILPNIYSVVNQSQTVINAKINVLFSPEAYLRNLGYEGINNVLIQKNFLFDWRAFDYSKMQFTDLMQVWNQRLDVPGVLPVLYVLAGFCVIGVVFSIFKKDKIGISILAVSLYALFFLSGGGRYPGILSEALRMPFTKFSIIFDFCLAFFFGYFFFQIIAVLKPKFIKIFFGIVLLIIVPSGLIFTTLPMFNGGLISPIVRRNLPNEYKELFGWFSKNPTGRVATLPMINLWGWDYNSWNYEGSGFLTYGISNPLLVRDFDRWSSNNEDFYSQASFALYANEPESFINALKKYQVKYLILDESVINAGGTNDIAYISQIKNILATSSGISKAIEFGFLSVYQTDFTQPEVSAPRKFYKVSANLTYSKVDPIYPLGDYVEDSLGTKLPFINLDSRSDVKISVTESGGSSEVKFVSANTPSSAIFSVPNPITENLSQDRGQKSPVNCDLQKIGSVDKKITNEGILYSSIGGGVSCDNFDYPDFKYSQGFVLRIAGENRTGRSLKIYLFNLATGEPDLQELMPVGKFDEYYYVYPKNLDGAGYSLNFETRSFTGTPSSNLLTKVEIYPANYEFMTGMYAERPELNFSENPISIINTRKYGNWAYKVDVQGGGLIQLGQGYDPGWIAISTWNYQLSIYNLQLKHTKINSWANGWIVPANQPSNQSTIYLVFWPQLLEWGGLLIGVITLLVILVKVRQS